MPLTTLLISIVISSASSSLRGPRIIDMSHASTTFRIPWKRENEPETPIEPLMPYSQAWIRENETGTPIEPQSTYSLSWAAAHVTRGCIRFLRLITHLFAIGSTTPMELPITIYDSWSAENSTTTSYPLDSMASETTTRTVEPTRLYGRTM